MRKFVSVFFAAALLGAPLAVCAFEGRASADNLVFAIGPTTYRIAHLEAEGASLASADIAKLFDAADPTPVAERLSRLSAAKIFIPEIIGEAKIADVTEKLVYRDVTLEKVAGARIAVMRAKSLDSTGEHQNGVRTTVKYGAMTIKGVDLAQMTRVLHAARIDEAEAAKPIEDEATIEGISVVTSTVKGELSIGRATAAGVKARALKQPFAQMLEKLPAAGGPPDAATLLDLFSAFQLASLDLRDVALVGEAPPPGKPFALKLGRIGLTNIADGKSGEAALEGFELASGDGGRITIGRIGLRDVDLRPAIGDGPRRYPHVARLEISGLDIDIPDAKAGEGRRVRFRLGAAAQDFSDWREGLPTKLDLQIDHALFDLSANETPVTAQFTALGYKEIDLSGRISAQWREKEQQIVVGPARLDAPTLGGVELSATLAGARPELFSTNPEVAKLAAAGLAPTLVDVLVRDGEILDRAIASEAKESGDPAPKLRADLAQGASSALAAALGGENDKSRRISAAIKAFIETPRRLHIRLSSQKGVGLLDVIARKPAEILDNLDVEASAQ